MPVVTTGTSGAEEAVYSLEQQVEGIQLDQSRRQMYAEFKTSFDSNNRVINKVVNLYLFTDYYEKTWKLRLNLKSFEVMHGLSRVALLVPDKLATAIAINKEDLPDPDDGGFLVQLVEDLVVFYRDQLTRPANQPQLEDNTENIVSRVEELGGETQESFRTPEVITELLEILNKFITKLISIKDNLKARNVDGINSDAILILQMADDILELSTAYMDFVHPIYLDIERHGTFNEEKIEELKPKLNDKLVENKKKLQQEFDSLTKPRETEE